MSKELSSISEFYRMLLQEACHKEFPKQKTASNTMAFVVDKRHHNDKSSYMPSSTGTKKPSYFCDNCKIPGHSIDRCFKLHGYPNKNKGKKFSGSVLDDNIQEKTLVRILVSLMNNFLIYFPFLTNNIQSKTLTLTTIVMYSVPQLLQVCLFLFQVEMPHNR